jgi:hypothetical protein
LRRSFWRLPVTREGRSEVVPTSALIRFAIRKCGRLVEEPQCRAPFRTARSAVPLPGTCRFEVPTAPRTRRLLMLERSGAGHVFAPLDEAPSTSGCHEPSQWCAGLRPQTQPASFITSRSEKRCSCALWHAMQSPFVFNSTCARAGRRDPPGTTSRRAFTARRPREGGRGFRGRRTRRNSNDSVHLHKCSTRGDETRAKLGVTPRSARTYRGVVARGAIRISFIARTVPGPGGGARPDTRYAALMDARDSGKGPGPRGPPRTAHSYSAVCASARCRFNARSTRADWSRCRRMPSRRSATPCNSR